jgi:hypothetical protein
LFYFSLEIVARKEKNPTKFAIKQYFRKIQTMYNSHRPRKSFHSSRSHNGRRKENNTKTSKRILLVVLLLLIFWGGRSIFSGGEELSAEAKIDIRRGVLEFSLDGDDLWTRGNSGQKFLQGDRIRCTGNCEASIELLDGGSVVVLAPNAELTFTELKQDSEGRKNIELHLEQGELWGSIAENEFLNKNSHFLITTPSSEISIKGAIVDVTTGVSDLIRVLRGKLELRAINTDGDKSDPLDVNIGQQILVDTASKELFFTDTPVKALESLDNTFEESEWNLKNLELFSPQEAASIRHRIERSATPVLQDPSKNGNDSPTITTPVSGIVIPAAEDMLQLEGLAPLDAYRISINGYTLTKFQPGDRKWSYFASKKFGTLVPGENTFNVVSISRDGKESAPAVVTVTYDATSAPVVVAEATSDFPVPVIQSPASTDSTQPFVTSDAVLDITGIVDPRTVAVEVNGFRLKKFQTGDTAWKYTANANYGNMSLGENVYTVIAIGPNDEHSSASIRVNYTPK